MNNSKIRILSKLAALDSNKSNKDLSKYANELILAIQKSKNNNQVFENLELLEQIIYQAPLKVLKVIKSIVNTKSPIKPTVHINKIYGKIEGKSHNDLLLKCLELLSKLRYINTKEVFKLLTKLSNNDSSNIKSKSIEKIRELCQYNLFVINKIGYFTQKDILDNMQQWSVKKIINNIDLVLEATKQFLQPTYEGNSMTDYKTYTLRHGALLVNRDLKYIRNHTLMLLTSIYLKTAGIVQRKRILQILNEASQTPRSGTIKKDMRKMIAENTNKIIDFYINISQKEENELIKTIEHQSNRFMHRLKEKNLTKIKRLQKIISSNEQYEMFRSFVGYDYEFSKERDWKKTERIRKAKIQEYIDDITETNFNKWQEKVLLVLKNYSPSKFGEYQYFGLFLHELSKQKPHIALELINNNEAKLESFFMRSVTGLWESSHSNIAKDLLSNWIRSNKYLYICAGVFAYLKEIDIGLLEKTFKKAKKSKDIYALNNIVNSIATNYPKYKNFEPLFVLCIKELTRNKSSHWVHGTWYQPKSILSSFAEDSFDVILENLLLSPSINHEEEEMLTHIAKKHPKKIVYFFCNRVTMKTKKQNDLRYDAVPFDLSKLHEPLQKHATVVIPEIIKWFSKKNWLYEWEASHFINAIFPTFHSKLEVELTKLIKTKKERNAKTVLAILKAYRGETFLHKTCKNFIKYSPYAKKYKGSVFMVLSQTGVVSGEYGFVNAYTKKLEEIQDWKKDRSKAIKSFVKDYEIQLNKQISYEQKRADEDLELRKRQYDSS